MGISKSIFVAALFQVATAFAASPFLALPLPGGDGGIGFDDLKFSSGLNRVLVPSGRTGRLNLVAPHPVAHLVESISGFSAEPAGSRGHGKGTTSADSGRGWVFASDRGNQHLVLVDPGQQKVVGFVELGGNPDYVRWVEPLGEVWVTEPVQKQIERFKLASAIETKLVKSGRIEIADGPESLVIDVIRHRAYTNTWHGETIVIDLASQQESSRWSNGCRAARGIALDEKRGWLFVGCEEGKAVMLDVVHQGKRLAEGNSGKGVDTIAYSPSLAHLYVPGGDSATLTVFSVGQEGIKPVAKWPTAPGAQCVAADDSGNVYICDRPMGRLRVFSDTLAAARE